MHGVAGKPAHSGIHGYGQLGAHLSGTRQEMAQVPEGLARVEGFEGHGERDAGD